METLANTVTYPSNYEENVRFRVNLYKNTEKDIYLQKHIKEYCARDVLFWVNSFCYTKDPRKTPDVMPFVCYESYEEDYILSIQEAIDNQYDLLTEKSRDMGVSWMILYVFMHKWLFESGSDFRIGSRKEEFVDKPKVIDTLFEKIRFNLSKQPKWLMPEGFDWGSHSTYMKIHNPELGNTMVGESANEDFGSGGRSKAILLDEFAKWDDNKATAAFTSTADVTKCRIICSTPKGAANKFAVLARGTKERIKKITLHWTLHPEKAKDSYSLQGNAKTLISTLQEAFSLWQKLRSKGAPGLKGGLIRSPWYDTEAERRTDIDLAQEVDIDYHRSGSPFFDLNALAQQKPWEFMERSSPHASIPYGKYIRGNLVEIDGHMELREMDMGWLIVFELPSSSYSYVIGADSSEGLPKGDESFGVVRDCWARNVVACFHGAYPPDIFANYINKVSFFYNKALQAPENNNHGYATCQELDKMDGPIYKTVRTSPDGKETITKLGWTTDARSRPLMLDSTEEEIRKASCELRYDVLINQFETFIRREKDGKPEADGDFCDDGVISFAIAGQVISSMPRKIDSKTHNARQRLIVEERTKRRNGGFRY